MAKKPEPFDFTEVFSWDEKMKEEKAKELAEKYSAPNYDLGGSAVPFMPAEGGVANPAPLAGGPAGMAGPPPTPGAGGSGIPPQMQMQLMQMMMQQQNPQQPPPNLPQLTGGQPMPPPDFFSGLARSR